MKILILDDDPSRHKKFKQTFVGADVKSVTTVKDCIAELKHNIWDAVFLDHDLGGKAFVNPAEEEETGYHVARWLEQNPDRKPSTVVIHSLNYDGAQRMKSRIPDAIIAPWAWETAKVEDR